MALKFILGRAGAGKTHYCLEQVRAALRQSPVGSPLIMLVPEQATFQIEQALAATPGLAGFLRAHVFSFQRLAYHISLELGGAAQPRISEIGRLMALRKILQAKTKELTVLSKAARRSGFTDKLAAALAELKMYRITSWELAGTVKYLEATAQHLVLQNKLKDMGILYQAWEEFLSDRYQDMEDCLNLLAEQIPQSAFTRQATIWIDGFKGFTPQEFYVIGQMLHTADVDISLCLDPAAKALAAKDTSVFHPVWQTWQKLLKIAAENGVEVQYVELCPEALPRFAAAPALSHLEKEFFSYPCRSFTGPAQQQIELSCAANPRAEIEAAARKIRELCRHAAVRYRDITILLRDMTSYSSLIETIFADYDIPVFVDEKRGILHHPLAELIRSSLEIVAGNWGYDAVLRYLKTDLTGQQRDEIDSLENYVLAHGIRGGRWTDGQRWAYTLRYTLEEEEAAEISAEEKILLERIDEIRRRIVGPLKLFHDALKGERTVAEITTALVQLCMTLEIPQKLAQWGREALEAGALIRAEHQQIWNSSIALFEQMVETLGEQKMSLEEYGQVLETGLETLELGLIPPGLDQVLVASLDRSRSPRVFAAFVLGVNEGIYPVRVTDDDIFSSPDREYLKTIGLELAPGRGERIIEEQFLLYTALTRAGGYLWLSYVQADNEGKGTAPSYVIRRLKELFPALGEEQRITIEPEGNDDLSFISHPRRTLGHLAGKLREAKAGHRINEIWWSVYQWAAADNRQREVLQRIIAGLRHKNQDGPLKEETIRTLYGNPLRVSVSKIESFRRCPFSYFASFALKLKKRPVFQLEAPGLGQFYHAVLKTAGEQLFYDGHTWGDLSPAACVNLVNETVEKIAPRLQSEILLSSARYKYLARKIRQVITRSVLTLAEHDRRGCFRPRELELSFGPGGKLPPLKLQLESGQSIEVEGRIDRIDYAENTTGIYLRVIDYKMGDERLQLPEMYYGLRLQLITYLHAALSLMPQHSGQPLKAGGLLYFRIQDPLLHCESAPAATELEREILKMMKMRGFIIADPGVAGLMDDKLGVDGYRTSELIPVNLLKDGAFDGRSAVLETGQIEALLRHAEQLLAQSGADILQGVVDINPYKMQSQTACTHCRFSSVCQFDELLEDNVYNHLHRLTPALIWRSLGFAVQEEKDG